MTNKSRHPFPKRVSVFFCFLWSIRKAYSYLHAGMLLPPDLAYSVAIGASLQLADIRFSIMYHIKRFLIHKTGFNTHLVPQKRFMWYQIIILSNLSGDRPVFSGRFSDSAINCHGSRRRSVPVRSGVFTSSAARGTCAVESFAVAHPSQQSWAP